MQARKHQEEIAAIKERYEKRSFLYDARYDPLNEYNIMVVRERFMRIQELVRRCGLRPVGDKRLLEIGCGSGTNLLQLILIGFKPQNLVANELLPDRAAQARSNLPKAIPVIVGDAAELDLDPESFDLVLQSTVFTSILDHGVQETLARKMWLWLKPGGGVIWYDFIYSNPRNQDVRGVSLKRIRELFPDGKMKYWRVTLAPPIGRKVTKLSRHLYTVLNLFPFLRTHVLCWIEKKPALG